MLVGPELEARAQTSRPRHGRRLTTSRLAELGRADRPVGVLPPSAPRRVEVARQDAVGQGPGKTRRRRRRAVVEGQRLVGLLAQHGHTKPRRVVHTPATESKVSAGLRLASVPPTDAVQAVQDRPARRRPAWPVGPPQRPTVVLMAERPLPATGLAPMLGPDR